MTWLLMRGTGLGNFNYDPKGWCGAVSMNKCGLTQLIVGYGLGAYQGKWASYTAVSGRLLIVLEGMCVKVCLDRKDVLWCKV